MEIGEAVFVVEVWGVEEVDFGVFFWVVYVFVGFYFVEVDSAVVGLFWVVCDVDYWGGEEDFVFVGWVEDEGGFVVLEGGVLGLVEVEMGVF